MEHRGLDDDDPMFEVTQKLIGLPAHEALKALQLMQEEEDES